LKQKLPRAKELADTLNCLLFRLAEKKYFQSLHLLSIADKPIFAKI
jgi:hypothetical protein